MSKRKHQQSRRRDYVEELRARWSEWLTGRNTTRSSESRYWPFYASPVAMLGMAGDEVRRG